MNGYLKLEMIRQPWCINCGVCVCVRVCGCLGVCPFGPHIVKKIDFFQKEMYKKAVTLWNDLSLSIWVSERCGHNASQHHVCVSVCVVFVRSCVCVISLDWLWTCCSNLCQLLNWACCLSSLPASLLIDCFPPCASLYQPLPLSVPLLLSPSDALLYLCLTSSQSAFRTVFNLSLCPSSCQSMCSPLFTLVLIPCIYSSIFLPWLCGFWISQTKNNVSLCGCFLSGWFSFHLSLFPFSFYSFHAVHVFRSCGLTSSW